MRGTGYLDAPTPIAFAHRGGAARWPENTLEAIAGALALGYRYVETDVHLTRDGEVVLLHDDRVDRTTDGHGDVRDLTLADLRRLDAGYRFEAQGAYPFRGREIRVPTLLEALALSSDLRLNLELKHREPDLVRPLWALIEAHGLHDRVLVASADDDVGAAFRRVSGGRVRTSAGLYGVLRFWTATRARVSRLLHLPFDALQVPPTRGPLVVVDRAFVEAAHRHGVQVHVWTVDARAEMERLLRLGVDGLMTDRPELLLEVIAATRA